MYCWLHWPSSLETMFHKDPSRSWCWLRVQTAKLQSPIRCRSRADYPFVVSDEISVAIMQTRLALLLPARVSSTVAVRSVGSSSRTLPSRRNSAMEFAATDLLTMHVELLPPSNVTIAISVVWPLLPAGLYNRAHLNQPRIPKLATNTVPGSLLDKTEDSFLTIRIDLEILEQLREDSMHSTCSYIDR